MKLLLPLGISMHFITREAEATMEASRCLGLHLLILSCSLS